MTGVSGTGVSGTGLTGTQVTGISRITGRVINDTDHLAQSISDILATPVGSRVMPSRAYGSMLADLVDHPLNGAGELLIFAASAIALSRWEPRLKARRFALNVTAEGKAMLTITGERTDMAAANTKVVISLPIRTGGAPVSAAQGMGAGTHQ